jgi:hypothetical protein
LVAVILIEIALLALAAYGLFNLLYEKFNFIDFFGRFITFTKAFPNEMMFDYDIGNKLISNMNLSNNNDKYINNLSNSNAYDFERTCQIYISSVSTISKQYHISISDVIHDGFSFITSVAELLIVKIVESLHSYSHKVFNFSQEIGKKIM